MSVQTQIYVGKSKPSGSAVNPVRNRRSSAKPEGGFWTSPIKDDGLSAFERFENGTLVGRDDKVWKLVPSAGCNVFKVNSVSDLEKLPEKEDDRWTSDKTYIDFEEFFSQGYDGLFIRGDVAHRKSFSHEYNLYAWDFDTVLWNNIGWVKKMEKIGPAKERI